MGQLGGKTVGVTGASDGPSAWGPPCAEAVKATFRATVPLGRHGTTEEVAAAVAFLASDQSNFAGHKPLCRRRREPALTTLCAVVDGA
jgi:NAD(P)-dependent dehydrogenase (short-subunit alcohol dehydrogenase family)